VNALQSWVKLEIISTVPVGGTLWYGAVGGTLWYCDGAVGCTPPRAPFDHI